MEEIMAEMEHSYVCKRPLAVHAAQLEAQLARPSLRFSSKTTEADKANLETEFRDRHARIADVELENDKEEDEIISVKETQKKIYDEIVSLKDELKKWKAEVEMVRKKEEVASLKEEVRFVKDNAKEVGIEKEKAREVASKKDDDVSSLKEDLYVAMEKSFKAMQEVVAMEWKMRVILAQQKVLNFSFKEELRLIKEKGREELEIEKKKMTAVVAEKENELATLKQELTLAREKGMDEVEVRNSKVVAEKEVEIKLTKENIAAGIKQVIIAAGMREEELQRETTQLKKFISELGKIRELHFKVKDDVLVQSSRGVNLTVRERSKLLWVIAAAVVVCIGAAAITTFYLCHKREK